MGGFQAVSGHDARLLDEALVKGLSCFSKIQSAESREGGQGLAAISVVCNLIRSVSQPGIPCLH